jgi:hypothetical protein
MVRRMQKRTPLKRTPVRRKARKKQPGDDPEYLAWIRTLCCWVCMTQARVIRPSVHVGYCSLQESPTEPHHAGDHGYAQKAPDRTAIPLCAKHHRYGKDSAHVLGKNFWTYHGLNRDRVISELNERYNQLNA